MYFPGTMTRPRKRLDMLNLSFSGVSAEVPATVSIADAVGCRYS
jgi:hypothetical protein